MRWLSVPLLLALLNASDSATVDHHKHGHGNHLHEDDNHGDHDHRHNHKLGDHLSQVLSKDQDHYHPSIKPDGKVLVDVSMTIRSVGPLQLNPLNPKDGQAKLTMMVTYRESFLDKRLADANRNSTATLTGNDCAEIWTPDTFFRNSVEEELVGGVKPNCFARIDPSGQVLVSRRMKIASMVWGDEFKPPMTFNLPIASYAYKKCCVEYTANPDDIKLGSMAKKDVSKSNFKLDQIRTETDTAETTTGQYSLLNVFFDFSQRA